MEPRIVAPRFRGSGDLVRSPKAQHYERIVAVTARASFNVCPTRADVDALVAGIARSAALHYGARGLLGGSVETTTDLMVG